MRIYSLLSFLQIWRRMQKRQVNFYWLTKKLRLSLEISRNFRFLEGVTLSLPVPNIIQVVQKSTERRNKNSFILLIKVWFSLSQVLWKHSCSTNFYKVLLSRILTNPTKVLCSVKQHCVALGSSEHLHHQLIHNSRNTYFLGKYNLTLRE